MSRLRELKSNHSTLRGWFQATVDKESMIASMEMLAQNCMSRPLELKSFVRVFHLMSSRIRNLIRLAGGPIDQGYECIQVRQPP